MLDDTKEDTLINYLAVSTDNDENEEKVIIPQDETPEEG
jgi:hypothetical protein